jgi:chromosome segregation ATPase
MDNVHAQEKMKRLEQALSEQKEQNQAQRQHIQTLMTQLSVMQSRLDELLGILYGQRSEKQRATKLPDTQPTDVSHKVIRSRCRAHNDTHPGRRRLPEQDRKSVV